MSFIGKPIIQKASNIRIPGYLLVALSSWISKFVSAGLMIVSIRILTNFLNEEEYALYTLFISISTWYLLIDFGLGFSLQNFISESRIKKQDHSVLVSNSLTLMLIFSCIAILIVLLCANLIVDTFLNSFSLSTSQKYHLFVSLSLLSVGYAFSVIINKVWYGEQKGYWANLFTGLSSVANFIVIYFISQSTLTQKLYYSLLAYVGLNFVFTFVPMVIDFLFIRKIFFRFDIPVLRRLLQRAYKFSFFAIMAAFVLQLDLIIMASFVSKNEMVIYGIVSKVFTFIFFVYNAMLMALWPTFSELLALGNVAEVKRKIKIYIVLGIIGFSLSTAILLFFMPFILKVLTPSLNLYVPGSVILLFGFYFIIRVWADTYAMTLQSMNYLKPLWVLVPIQALISVFFQYLLSNRIGIYGTLAALIISYLSTVVWALPYFFSQRVTTTTV